MNGSSGAAEYWYWDTIDQNNLYPTYAAASSYLSASGLPDQSGLVTASLATQTTDRAPLSFTPSGGWASARQTEFIVPSSGPPVGIDQFPAYFQGRNHHDMIPKPLSLQVNAAQATAFNMTISQVAKAGAHIVISVDGKQVDRSFAPGDADYKPKANEATISAPVPQGVHTITVQNDGADWVLLGPMSLSDYAPALAANAVSNKSFVAAWIYNRKTIDGSQSAESAQVTGSITLPQLKAGKYRATWWDTHSGKSISETDVTEPSSGSTGVKLDTPPVATDVALYVVSATVPKSNARSGRNSRGQNQTGSTPAVTTSTPVTSTNIVTPALGAQTQK
jgi:hypothetical protein